MAMVTLIHSSHLAHADYADAAVIEEGHQLVVLAGVCPLDERGEPVAAGDIVAQMRRSLANMEMALADCGLVTTDVASVRILVATRHRDDLVAAWGAFRAHFGDHDVPATLMGVTVLGYVDQLVELEVIGARELERLPR